MKVLIGVDGSPLSLDAVRVVGHIIDPTEDQVAIYFSPTELQQRLPESSSSIVSRSAADLFAEARALLPTEFAKPVEMISSSASAAVGILESANGWHADLVAVGARSHGSIERFLLGSVSRAVLHGAHLPVLIVRSHPPEDGSFRTLGLPSPSECICSQQNTTGTALVENNRGKCHRRSRINARWPTPKMA